MSREVIPKCTYIQDFKTSNISFINLDNPSIFIPKINIHHPSRIPRNFSTPSNPKITRTITILRLPVGTGFQPFIGKCKCISSLPLPLTPDKLRIVFPHRKPGFPPDNKIS